MQNLFANGQTLPSINFKNGNIISNDLDWVSKFSITGLLNNNGYSLGIGYKTNHPIIYLMYCNFHSPKEEKINSQYKQIIPYEKPKSYRYGKENNVNTLDILIQNPVPLFKVNNKSNLKFFVEPALGLSLMFLSPYNLYIIDSSNSDYISNQKYSNQNRVLFLDKNTIYSRGKKLGNWKEIKINPGLRFSLQCRMSLDQNNLNKDLIIGSSFSYYYKKFNFMIDEKPFHILPDIYLGLRFSIKNKK